MTRLRLLLPLALALALVSVPTAAHAQVQTSGQEVFPGKFQVGFHPFGTQVGFGSQSVSGYKLAVDFSGLIGSVSNMSLWLGGGFANTFGTYDCVGFGFGVFGLGVDCGDDVQFWAYAQLTLEKLIHFPIVPYIRVGLAGDILVYGDTGGAVALRFGGGADYWLLKWLGFGAETYFTMGPGFHHGTFFYGSWDLNFGAKFAF